MKEIPEGWRQGRLDQFLVLQRGFDLTQKEACEGDIPVVSSSGVSYYHNVAKVLPPGVVTGRKGKLGDVYFMDAPFWPHDTTLWVKDFKNNEPRFVKLFLEGFNLERFDAATSVPTLNRNNVHKLRVSFPPLAEQRRIVEVVDAWDEAIALTERRIETARQHKKGLMQRLLTGRVRFPEFADEEWQEVRLGKVFTERKEQGYEDLPLLSVTADRGIIHRDELDRRDTSSADKSKYLRVCKGDIAYNTMRMWQGRSGVSKLEGIVSPAYTVCKPKPSIDSDFMGYLFQLPSVVCLFRRYSQGMVSDTWNLKFKHLAQIHIRIPEIREQRRIAAVLQTCDREVELLTQKRDALQRQKKGLMQRLLTGRVRVEV